MIGNVDWLLRIDVDAAAWIYAALVGVYLPIVATRARSRLANAAEPAPRAFRKGAAAGQLAMLTLATVVAWTHGLRTLPLPVAAWEWLLVAPAVALVELLRWVAWKTMTLEQRRSLWVRTILPSRAELPEWTALT